MSQEESKKKVKYNKPLLSILDRYIIKKFLGTYVFSITLIISIAVIFDINEKLDKFLRNNASLKAIVFDYYLNFIPYYTNLFSALFVFIAVIFFTSTMANNSEIIAMLSNGMSFKRMMKPYMISAAVIALVSFLLSSFVIPPANITRIAFQNRFVSNKKVDYVARIQVQIEPGVIAFIESYDDNNKSGRNFSLDKFKNKELVSRLTAREIEYTGGYHWIIKDYSIREFNGRKETITTGASLDSTLNMMPQNFLISINDFETMTTPQLYKYINQQKDRGIGNIKGFEIEYHKRFASIASAFILTIIGAALSSRKIKGGMGLNIGIGLLLSVSYILFMTVTSSFAVSGLVSPLIAAWIPNIIFSFIAAFLYKRAPN